jgi:hypothetical protein
MKTISLLRALVVLTLMTWSVVAKADYTVTFSSSLAPSLLRLDGGQLSTGSLIRLGYFDLSGGGLNTIQNSNDYAAVNALFKPLAEGINNAGAVVQAGGSGNTLVINDLFNPGDAFGEIDAISASYIAESVALYAWVFSGSDAATANQWGIFGSSTAWFAPPDQGSVVLSTNDLNVVLRGSKDLNNNFRLDNIPASVVPEPSGALLIGAAGMLLIMRRSTRKRA